MTATPSPLAAAAARAALAIASGDSSALAEERALFAGADGVWARHARDIIDAYTRRRIGARAAAEDLAELAQLG